MATNRAIGALPEGIGVASVSLFDLDGGLELATTRKAIPCVDRGVRSILIGGTTGEPWRLTAVDRVELGVAVKTALPDVPVFIGSGDTSAARAIAITERVADEAVADGLVILAANDMPVEDFYRAIVDSAGDTPVLAYHLPTLTPVGVPDEAMPSLPLAGIKNSSGDADRLARLLRDGLRFCVGSPNLLAIAGPCGAAGAFLALANTVPETCETAWNGDAAAQRTVFAAHLDSLVDFPTRLKPPGAV